MSVLSADGAYKSVGVPSRLYFPEPSPEKPLSGVRVSISDAMALNGVPISMSSRAWSSVYPYGSSKTAAYAQKLMDLGAVIVGKTKVSQFAAGAEWVDEKAPWNPRGEGYQDASGSAAGAGAAMASYDWLAHAIGEDGKFFFRIQATRGDFLGTKAEYTFSCGWFARSCCSEWRLRTSTLVYKRHSFQRSHQFAVSIQRQTKLQSQANLSKTVSSILLGYLQGIWAICPAQPRLFWAPRMNLLSRSCSTSATSRTA